MNSVDKWKPVKDPVFKGKDGFWYFWDETWTDDYGPYDTKEIARDRAEDYCNYIGGCGIN